MKRDALNITVLVIVIFIFAAISFYFYTGLRSDLNTIIAGKSLSIQTADTDSSQPVASTPTVGVNTATPLPSETALSIQTTPTTSASIVSDDFKSVIIYNTHPFEKLETGAEITEYSKLLANKLNDSGVLSIFLNNNNRLINDSYEKSRNLVKDNIREYSGNILLDVHASDDIHVSSKEISIWVGKGNKDYEKNMRFANNLLKEIKNTEPDLDGEVLLIDKYLWNQDLSDKTVLLIIGNKIKSDESANGIIKILSDAIKNMQG